MDLVTILYLLMAGTFIFGLVFGWLIGYIRRPDMWAWLLRRVTGKNYIVAALRHRGGQLKQYVVLWDKPTITIRNKDYMPVENQRVSDAGVKKPSIVINGIEYELDESDATHIGSVPIYFFDDRNVHSISLMGTPTDKKYLDPAHLNATFMLMKAIYEALAAKKNDILKLLAIGTIVLIFISLFLSYVSYNEISGLRGQVAQIGAYLQAQSNQTAAVLPNALGK